MGQTLTRGLRVSMLTRWAAAASASSAAARSPSSQSRQRLPGASSWSAGASSPSAAFASVTAGSGRYVTVTASAASWAWAALSATTKATGSPTMRTRPAASTGRGGRAAALPSALLGRHHAGDRTDPRCRKVGSGVDGVHARHRQGGLSLDRTDLGMGVGRAHHAAPRLAGQREIVEIAPAAGEEALVLRPSRRRADSVCHSDPALPSMRRQVR